MVIFVKTDTPKPEEIISELQNQLPFLIAKLRAIRPECEPLECYYALPELRDKMALLSDVMKSVELKELIDLIEDSKLGSTKDCLAVYGALLMIKGRYDAVAWNWFQENTFLGS